MNRVDELTNADYVEVPVRRITAGWAVGNVAAHGFDYTDAIEGIDGRRPVTGGEDGRRARHVSDFKMA